MRPPALSNLLSLLILLTSFCNPARKITSSSNWDNWWINRPYSVIVPLISSCVSKSGEFRTCKPTQIQRYASHFIIMNVSRCAGNRIMFAPSGKRYVTPTGRLEYRKSHKVRLAAYPPRAVSQTKH